MWYNTWIFGESPADVIVFLSQMKSQMGNICFRPDVRKHLSKWGWDWREIDVFTFDGNQTVQNDNEAVDDVNELSYCAARISGLIQNWLTAVTIPHDC